MPQIYCTLHGRWLEQCSEYPRCGLLSVLRADGQPASQPARPPARRPFIHARWLDRQRGRRRPKTPHQRGGERERERERGKGNERTNEIVRRRRQPNANDVVRQKPFRRPLSLSLAASYRAVPQSKGCLDRLWCI